MGFSANTGDSGFISAFGAEGTVQPATKYVRLARLLDLRRPDQSPQPTTAGTLRLITGSTIRVSASAKDSRMRGGMNGARGGAPDVPAVLIAIFVAWVAAAGFLYAALIGAKTPQEQTVETLEHVIREAGRDPIQRDSYYRHLPRKRPAAAPAPPAVESELVLA